LTEDSNERVEKSQDDERLREIAAFRAALQSDVEEALQNQRNKDSPYNRRALIRAFLAQVEGTIAFLKDMAIERAAANPEGFHRADLAVLYEETYALRQNGSAVVQPRYFPIADAFCFVVLVGPHL
jgi:hypothetical protein